MYDIRHQIRIKGSKKDVYRALATIEGLGNWWTRTTTGQSLPGQAIDFRFGDPVSTMQVKELVPDARVAWECTASAPDWVGTRVCFELQETNGQTLLAFGHNAWREANPFFGQCSMKWATFLLSLKSYVETGKGAPFPDDLQV